MNNGIAWHGRVSAAARGIMVALVFGVLCVHGARAQSDPAKQSTDAPPDSSGFSIETEMFTYRALESNSEAIACDIAGYLNGAEDVFKSPPPGSICDVKPGKSRATVILLPFASSEFQDFQIWRADMATMARLNHKARVDCPSVSAASNKGGVNAATSKLASAVSDVVGASPAGPPLALAQSVLSLVASGVATSSVGGTIHDQAFMDGVGRELQELSVPVLMPTGYTPFSLVALDETGSPFLASLNKILIDRDECLKDSASHETTSHETTKPKDTKPTASNPQPNTPQSMILQIDAYLNTLTSDALLAPKDNGGAAPGKNPGGAPAAPSSSHLSAVLMADGLAAKLGVDPETGTLSPDDRASVHVLLIQALESGGSVTRLSNILGTKIRYSGGSVGTYALFTLDGDLECSGNVYEYGESPKSKDVLGALAAYRPDPAKQMIFLRHSCKRLSRMR